MGTIVDPGTVMVKTSNTAIADGTVLAARGSIRVRRGGRHYDKGRRLVGLGGGAGLAVPGAIEERVVGVLGHVVSRVLLGDHTRVRPHDVEKPAYCGPDKDMAEDPEEGGEISDKRKRGRGRRTCE